MSADEYRAVLEAKVLGTWNLHHASLAVSEQPLDFFTLLSSLSGVAGNKGQANYAAAGAFLDAFAHYRHNRNLRAHALDLAAIHDVGYIAEQGAARRLEEKIDREQWTPLDESTLHRVFDYSILQQQGGKRGGDGGDRTWLSRASAAQTVTGLTVPLSESSDLAVDPRFGHLLATDASMRMDIAKQNPGEGDDAALQELRVLHSSPSKSTNAQAITQACIRVLATQIARILRLEAEVEPARPLTAYGLDSLAAVEMRGWLRTRLGAELSALDITNAPSLLALVEKVVDRLPTLAAPAT